MMKLTLIELSVILIYRLVGDEPDYSVLFYTADGLFVVVILLITRLDVDIERVEASSLAAGLRRYGHEI